MMDKHEGRGLSEFLDDRLEYRRFIDGMTLPYNSGPSLTRQTVSFSDLTALSTGHLRHAYGHHSARRNPYGLEPTCDAGCHVTLGRAPSGSIRDSLAANGGGKYLPTYVRRVLAVS